MHGIPHAHGMLEVTGVDRIHWELWGNPQGRPAVVVHGGPGSGVQCWHRQQWQALRDALPEELRGRDVVEAYCEMLRHPDPVVRDAAARAWCHWESITLQWPPQTALAPRFHDPLYAMAFARIVTHYVRHDAWLGDGRILTGAGSLAGIRGVLVNGRFDLQAPIGNAWALHRCWPGSELVTVDDAGHAADHPGITREIKRAIECFAWD